MKSRKRTPTPTLSVTQEQAKACTRHVLAAIAWWTSTLFDAGAPKRLAGKGSSTRQIPFDFEFDDFKGADSAGIYIESSAALNAVTLVHAFVETGLWPGTDEQLLAHLDPLAALQEVIRSRALRDTMDEQLIDPTPARILDHLIMTAHGRWFLYRNMPIDLPHLAKVAGLTEKTLRMAAMKPKRGLPAIATYKEGSKTLVQAKVANDWLKKRSDFNPTKIGGRKTALAFTPRTPSELAALLRALRAAAGLSVEDVERQLQLRSPYQHSYDELEGEYWDAEQIDSSLFDEAGIERLAEILKVKQVTPFVRGIAAFMAPFGLDRSRSKPLQRKTQEEKR